MDQERDPYQHLWTDPQPAEPAGPPRSSRWSNRAKAAGASAFFAAGAVGLAFGLSGHSVSASSSSASSPTTAVTPPPGEPNGPGGPEGHGFRHGLGPGPEFGGRVVHGQYTVKTGSGYKTVDIQVGTVKSVSPTSITVASADGFTATYSVQPSTVVDSQAGGISSVATTDQVVVSAVDGKPPTATSVVDRTKMRSSRQGFGFGPPPAPPTTTAPTSS